jgi:hypothetical protein
MFNYVMSVFSHGVPGVVISGLAIVLMVIALVIQSEWLMVFAALCTFPITYSMSSWSGILLAVRLLPILQLGSAFAISKREMLIAWVAPILPLLMVLSYLVRVVAAQFP